MKYLNDMIKTYEKELKLLKRTGESTVKVERLLEKLYLEAAEELM